MVESLHLSVGLWVVCGRDGVVYSKDATDV